VEYVLLLHRVEVRVIIDTYLLPKKVETNYHFEGTILPKRVNPVVA